MVFVSYIYGMELSVIIVNYNVKYFLKQCLDAVIKASDKIKVEVFVVDNNSKDGSVEMIKNRFPSVNLIENHENVGFSKANNQAIKVSKGKYILLLNPDTVVSEDTFERVVSFMDKTPKAGGLGIRMVDGNGDFLPESKRGLPTPEVAFYKIFGFSSLFPKSKKFGKYHLGHLPEHKINEIDILSGAFMLLRKETLDKVGLLDENFFMYGEDIDLSYRITLGGYKNYYYPKSTIIHYKGESTKKSSVNYVFIFYKAMAIFAEKHFGKNKASLFNILIKIAIFFRATLALFNRLIEISLLPIIDFSAMYFGLHIVKRLYQNNTAQFHEPLTVHLTLLTFSITIIICLLYAGGYDKPVKPRNITKGILFAIPINLLLFSIFKNQFLFDTRIALWGISIGIIGLILMRLLLHLTKISKLKTDLLTKKILMIGHGSNLEKTENLVSLTQPRANAKSFVTSSGLTKTDNVKDFLGKHNLSKPQEIIFCAGQTSYQKIIELMCNNRDANIEFKIAHPQSNFIIGSTNLNTSGELYTLQLKGIKSAKNRRLKRTLDLFTSFISLLLSPFTILFIKNKAIFFKNMSHVFIGKKSLVGYNFKGEHESLPHIKKGVLDYSYIINDDLNLKNISLTKLNRIYARDYSIFMDLKIILKGYFQLDKMI